MTAAEIEATLVQFEGLISETARQIIARGVELDAEDVKQLLRIKAWKAIAAYDPAHRLPLRNFVFGCVYNQRKDIEKRPRRHNASVDDLRARGERETITGQPMTARSDWFDGRYLSIDAEVIYARVEDEGLVLPCTLTAIECRVISLRLQGLLLIEIDRALGLSRAERERLMCSIRSKLADWAPIRRTRRAPTAPLPQVSPARAAQAA